MCKALAPWREDQPSLSDPFVVDCMYQLGIPDGLMVLLALGTARDAVPALHDAVNTSRKHNTVMEEAESGRG